MPKITQARQALNDLLLAEQQRKYPGLPQVWLIKKYNLNKANGLTAAIIMFLQLSGHQAERISVQGRMVDQRKTFTDVLGQTRQIGTVKYIKSSMQKGSADISSTIGGMSVKIEVKIGSDTQRPAQKVYQEQVERAGGLYWIVKTFEDFYEKYNNMIAE